MIDRELFLGNRGWSGEIGHVVVDPNGPRCLCGATGCLEQYAGKDAMLRAAGIGRTHPSIGSSTRSRRVRRRP
ncbi:ROK family protein [Oerskovia sp. M15]